MGLECKTECERFGHLPIYDSTNNCDWCELCGKMLYEYPPDEKPENSDE